MNQNSDTLASSLAADSAPAFGEATAKSVYAAGTLLAAIVVVSVFPFRDNLPLVLICGCLLALFYLRIWTVVPLFVLIQFELLMHESSSFGLPPRRLHGDVAFVGAVLVLLMAASRYFTFVGPIVTFDSLLFNSVWSPFRRLRPRQRHDRQLSHMLARDGRSFDRSEVIAGFVRVTLCVLIAGVLLSVLSLNSVAPDQVGLSPPILRTIQIGLLSLTVVILSHALLSALASDRSSASESRVYLRSILTRWCHAEIRSIVKRELKERRIRHH